MTQIFVVGYPKSGNTWLTRMIAKATSIPVRALNSAHSEIAADVNKEIGSEGAMDAGGVFKLHDMPEDFESRLAQQADGEKAKIVYIFRDIEDTFVSSFFYFRRNAIKSNISKPDIEQYVEKGGGLKRVLNPTWLIRHIYWRLKLNQYLRSFIRYGYSKDAVTYADHLSSWFEYLKKNKDRFEFAVTRYEDLMNNPVPEMSKICTRLGYDNLSSEAIEAIVRSESFSNRKKAIENSSDQLTLGKEFNKKFLRSGKVGDSKRFLTNNQVARLQGTLKNLASRP
ncbi:MAG TPA: sulfotransferase domain-containing protein [Gallionellaceae bacterium]